MIKRKAWFVIGKTHAYLLSTPNHGGQLGQQSFCWRNHKPIPLVGYQANRRSVLTKHCIDKHLHRSSLTIIRLFGEEDMEIGQTYKRYRRGGCLILLKNLYMTGAYWINDYSLGLTYLTRRYFYFASCHVYTQSVFFFPFYQTEIWGA